MSSMIENEARSQWDKTFLEIVSSYNKETIVEQVAAIEIPDLDPDPIMYGPGRIQHKIAAIAEAFKSLDTIFMNIFQKHRESKRLLIAEKSSYQVALRFLLAQDPKVRSGKTGQEREVLAQNLLQDKVLTLSKLEAVVSDLEVLLDLLKMKKADIKEVLSNLRTQMRLCEQQIQLGMRWGSKPEPKPFDMKPSPLRPQHPDLVDTVLHMGVEPQVDYEKMLADMTDMGSVSSVLDETDTSSGINETPPLAAPVKDNGSGLKPKPLSLEQSMTALEVTNILDSFEVKRPEPKTQDDDSFQEALSFLI